ncbi:TetR/AcrR family transcriptional regulator [Nocardia flavorosea]|uniref:TetR/AcrR family transcriptional regulator n=1 Tax=Nocardia flavorosea TaxID=53429 RepID=A0A846YLS1_9NOCA|nr:TetR/AcrR family transcriptional regulator [Nocardia flavorosea]NKY60606.1 TetR/AcrR family transcriptional regulator [Nocardia flavorosea]
MTETRERPRRGRPRTGPDPERFKEIMSAAANLFLEKGYDATSIQDIADSVGLLKGSLYHYVSSKEDFLFYVIKDTYAIALDEMSRVLELDVEPIARMAAFVRSHVFYAVANLTAYTIRLRELDKLSERRRAEVREGGRTYLGALQSILREGQEAGVFDRNLNVGPVSLMITGQLNDLTRWYSPAGAMSADALARTYAGLVLGSVVSDQAIAEHGGIEGLRRYAQQVDFGGPVAAETSLPASAS